MMAKGIWLLRLHLRRQIINRYNNYNGNTKRKHELSNMTILILLQSPLRGGRLEGAASST